MMLGLQGSTSPTKVFRCVACSATFTGLASLLVHQASHASTLPKAAAPPQPGSSPHDSSMDPSTEHPSPSTLDPQSPAPSFYICDCGEEFNDFSQMLEHKETHVPQLQQVNTLDKESPVSESGCDKSLLAQPSSLSPTIDQPDSVLSCPSTSRPPAVDLPPLAHSKSDVSSEDGNSIEIPPQNKSTPPQDEGEDQLEDMPAEIEQMSETADDMLFQDTTNSEYTNENNESSPKNDNLLKLIASAYRNCSPAPHSQSDNDVLVTPKQETVQVDVTPATKPEVPPINDLSIAQLRRLLSKPGIKTKAPSISKVLGSSKKRVVSLTKTFSPVVVLETRQKLKDPGGNCTYGRYQCGRCRRVFENLDRLTEHHFLHKKERIKCCRRCKQLIIGRVPLNDNHICPQLGKIPSQFSSTFKNKFPNAPKMMPFHSQNNARKVFFCPLCKHSYARRWNLKMHKCQGPRAAPPGPVDPSIQKMLSLRSNSQAITDVELNAGSQIGKSVAVGTEITSHIKVEVISPEINQPAVSQLPWMHPAQSFSPFYPKSSINEDAALHGLSLQQGEENSSWDAAAEDKDDDDDEGQWTVPLDDEIEVLSSAEKTGSGGEGAKSLSVEQPGRVPLSMRYFIRDGIKRYPCTRCQKTYSRPCTLRRHLRLCGFRPRGIDGAEQSDTLGDKSLNANSAPMFPCFVCGRIFNRKDNMMVHRKKCMLRRTMSEAAEGTAPQQSVSGNTVDGQSQGDDGGNWGIMSLPSVLPRRVTCECGAGFTSPRLLLEHLQKHAQESYTCPTCGETVNSWADYEVHLQIHMHPHHQLLKGLQSQRSQPLLLRFQQQASQQASSSVQQPPPPVQQPAPKQTIKALQFSSPSLKSQRLVCTRCGNTFASRCSLRRHLTWNRCKGARATTQPSNPPKTYHCSHCNSDFPNTISLLFHQRSGACKPAIKPVRCPVCLRWFGTVDSLQKHLLTHKQSESYRCDVCQGTYHSLKSLKNHRRRIHRIMAGDTNGNSSEQLAS